MTDKSSLYLDKVLPILRDWAKTIAASIDFSRAYIFGSLINRNERHFIPQGSIASDIDLVVVFSQRALCAEDRFVALRTLRSTIIDLEHRVCVALERTSAPPIFSILAVTEYEIRNCIHKGHDPKLFSSNLFLDIETGTRLERGLSGFVDPEYHYENLEPFSVIRLCQKYRNSFLSVNQSGVFTQSGFDGNTTFPKEIMRAAALINFFEASRFNDNLRTDLEEGHFFLIRVIESLKLESSIYERLCDTIRGRSFERTSSPVLSPEDMLLLHEILFDRAHNAVRPSVRDAIYEIMAKDTLS